MFEHRTHPIFSGVTSARSYHSVLAISLFIEPLGAGEYVNGG